MNVKMKNKFILDACCGPRLMWFNKHHPNTIYIDKRVREKGFVISGDKREVKPDIIMDFRKLEFPDKSFKLVVMDPPHLIGEESYIMTKSYGCLVAETWQSDLTRGFKECWRVLEDCGILIFKWNNTMIPFRKVLRLFDVDPLFGQKSVNKEHKKHYTMWFCFMKIPFTPKNI